MTLEQYLNGELQMASAENYPDVGPALVQDFPEVESYARLYNLGYKNKVIITNEESEANGDDRVDLHPGRWNGPVDRNGNSGFSKCGCCPGESGGKPPE